MIRTALPPLTAFAVAIVGALAFTFLEWPAFTLYVILLAAIVAYFIVLDFIDGHPRPRTRRP